MTTFGLRFSRAYLRWRLAERRRRALGGLLLRRTLERVVAPRAGRADPAAAAAAADAFLWELGRAYDVEHWDLHELRRAFLEGALEGWRPTTVQADALQIRVAGATCPFLAAAARDPSACQACQAFLAAVPRLAAPRHVQDVVFEALPTRGDPACSFRVVLASRPSAPPLVARLEAPIGLAARLLLGERRRSAGMPSDEPQGRSPSPPVHQDVRTARQIVRAPQGQPDARAPQRAPPVMPP